MLKTLLVSSPREVKNRQINKEIKIDLTSIHLIKLDIQKNIIETPRKPDQRTINKFSLKIDIFCIVCIAICNTTINKDKNN